MSYRLGGKCVLDLKGGGRLYLKKKLQGKRLLRQP